MIKEGLGSNPESFLFAHICALVDKSNIYVRCEKQGGFYMKVEYIPISEITMYPKNAKKHPKEQVERIANSIMEFGWQQPIVIDINNEIVIGHGRLLAAQKLGLEEVPVIRADNLTEEQIKALRLADNKTNESEWDLDFLDGELDSIFDIDMTQFGFDIPGVTEEYEPEEDDPFEDIERQEIHYGVPYQGNKSRIADIIISLLPSGTRLVDLFGGAVR